MHIGFRERSLVQADRPLEKRFRLRNALDAHSRQRVLLILLVYRTIGEDASQILAVALRL